MALDTQLIEVPLSGGLAEAYDRRLVPAGAFLSLKNCRRNRQAGFSKRFGTTALTRNILGGGTISSCVQIGGYDDSLLLISPDTIYSYSTSANAWIDRSNQLDTGGLGVKVKPFPATITHKPVLGFASRIVTLSQCTTSDGLIHYAMEVVIPGASDNAVYDLVWDQARSAIVTGPRLVDSIGYAPKVMNCNGIIVCVYSDGTNTIKGRTKATTTSAYGSATNLSTDQNTATSKRAWDAQAFGGSSNNFVFSYENGNAQPIQVKIYKNDLTSVATSNIADTISAIQCIALAPISGEGIWVAYGISSGGNQVAKMNRCSDTTAAPQFGTSTVFSGAPTANYGVLARLAVGRIDSTTAVVLGSTGEAFPKYPCVFRNTLTTGSVVGTQVNLLGYMLASRPFTAPDSRVYYWITDATQIDTTPTILARSLYLVDAQVMNSEQGAGRIVGRGPMRIMDNTVNSFLMARTVTEVIQGVAGAATSNNMYFMAPMLRQLTITDYPMDQVIATWNDPTRSKIIRYGVSAYIQPGQIFDRNKATEIGFHKIPDKPVVTATGAGLTGTYQFCVVFRYINSAGEVVRSSPSPITTITLNNQTWSDPTVLVTNFTDRQVRDAVTANPQPDYTHVEFYRTLQNGTTFYYATEKALPTSASIGSETISAVVSVNDTTVGANPILYTQGLGPTLPNYGPPSLKCLTVWNDRLVGIGPDLHTIWISNEYISGNHPVFNEAYNVQVPQDFLVALGIVDDKLIAFTNSNAYLIEGTAPNQVGANNGLYAQIMSADLGCTDERTVVLTNDGTIFQSIRSLATVDRSLKLEEIGLNAQDQMVANPVISSVTYYDFDREIRYTCKPSEGSATGIVLVYDIGSKGWATYEYYDPNAAQAATSLVSSTIVNGVWYGATSGGTVLQESRTIYTDSSQYVTSEITTPWIHLDSLASLVRAKKCFLQCERFTPHDISIAIALNENDTYVQTDSFSDTVIAAIPSLPVEQLIMRLATQKCNMVKARIRDNAPTGGGSVGTGQGVAYYSIAFQVGLKKAHVGKLFPSAQKV